MQQIYRKSSMSKCDFNKVALQLFEITLRHGCSPVNLLHIFRTPFLKNTSGRLLLKVIFIWSVHHRDIAFLCQTLIELDYFIFVILGNSFGDPEAVVRSFSIEKVFLEISQSSQENNRLEACNFIKKEVLAQVFSCEFCEISKNTLFLQNSSGGCFWRSAWNVHNVISFLE